MKDRTKARLLFGAAFLFFGASAAVSAVAGGDWPVPLLLAAWAFMELACWS